VSQVPTGLLGCNTTCGDVRVPYPFGFGHPGCYLPGFNLTCDTHHSPPRLLLDGNGNHTVQVVHISLRNSTVRVVHHHHGTDWTADVDHTLGYEYSSSGSLTGITSLMADFRLPTDIGEPYVLSTRNEFIVFSGWEVRATLHGEYRNGSSSNTTDNIISQAVCSSSGGGLESSEIVVLVGCRRSQHKPTANTAQVMMADAMSPSLQAARPREWNSKRSTRTSAIIMVIGRRPSHSRSSQRWGSLISDTRSST
jgi:hypothetical protein